MRAGDEPERGFAPQQPAEEGITATALLSVRGNQIQLCLEVGTLGLLPSSCTDFQSCELERPLCPWTRRQPRASRACFPCRAPYVPIALSRSLSWVNTAWLLTGKTLASIPICQTAL